MKNQINEIKRMQQLAGLIKENKAGWSGKPKPIPSKLRNEILNYSDSEKIINTKLKNKRLNGKWSDIFYEIDFESEEIFYVASAGPTEYDGEDFYEMESFDFGENDTAYGGEIEILKQLIEKIKEKGIQPNQK